METSFRKSHLWVSGNKVKKWAHLGPVRRAREHVFPNLGSGNHFRVPDEHMKLHNR